MILCCISAFGQKKTQGKASYYSDKLHGRTMSNGERYHRDSMTCAHLNSSSRHYAKSQESYQ